MHRAGGPSRAREHAKGTPRGAETRDMGRPVGHMRKSIGQGVGEDTTVYTLKKETNGIISAKYHPV